MQNDIWGSLEVFSNTLVPLVLALVNCIVDIARNGWHGVREFVQNFIIGAFVGVLVYWGLDYWELPPTVQASITGGCVLTSKSFLDAVQEKVISLIRDWKVRRKGE